MLAVGNKCRHKRHWMIRREPHRHTKLYCDPIQVSFPIVEKEYALLDDMMWATHAPPDHILRLLVAAALNTQSKDTVTR